jgi:hypothetical protein
MTSVEPSGTRRSPTRIGDSSRVRRVLAEERPATRRAKAFGKG